jgi:hypothetical protein
MEIKFADGIGAQPASLLREIRIHSLKGIADELREKKVH